MFCKHCGNKLSDGAKFCKNCGTVTLIVQKDQPTQPVQTVKPVEPQIIKPRESRKGWWIGGIVVGLIVLIGIIIIVLSSDNTTSSTVVSPQTTNTNNSQSVVDILCNTGKGGSGTIFTTDGTVLTNNHVIAGATICQVTVPNPATGQIAEIYNATPVITPILSKKYDIATLKIDGTYTDNSGKTWGSYPTTFQAFTLPSTCSTSTPSQLGDSVLIYGYPVTSGGYNLTITNGIISSFANNGDILTSAKVDSGNSGGLAVDQNGCWLGIPSAVISGNYQNLGVIIPGSVVENILADVPAKAQPFTPKVDTGTSQTSSGGTNDQQCQDYFGPNSEYAGSINNNGQPDCVCQNGYSWDTTGDACTSQISLDQSCQDTYGPGSYSYQKNLNQPNQKATCGCSSGYQFNAAGTACVNDTTSSNIAPTTSSSVPGCISGANYSETTGLSCAGDSSCRAGSTFDKDTNQCINDLTYCQNTEGANATYNATTNSCGCAIGYAYSGGSCVVDNGYSVCAAMNATWDGSSYTSSGGYNCTCDSGYTQSSDGTTCVPMTGYQICALAFPNETWDGTYGSDGKYNCVCDAGYTYDSYTQSCY